MTPDKQAPLHAILPSVVAVGKDRKGRNETFFVRILGKLMDRKGFVEDIGRDECPGYIIRTVRKRE